MPNLSKLNRVSGFVLACLCLASVSVAPAAEQSSDTASLKLWYTKPAVKWDEALPIGNGRLAAMVFGDPQKERLQLNEDTLTSDEPGYRTIPLDIRKTFDEVTGLIAKRQFGEADKLVTEKWLGRAWACYQPLGDLYLDFQHEKPVENYRRELDISRALCQVQYQSGGVTFTRQIFASHPDEVIVIRLSADKPGMLNFKVRLTSPHPTAVTSACTLGGPEHPQIWLNGQLPGLVLRRTLDWVEKKKDTWKYPELWDDKGNRLTQAKQVLYGKEINDRGTRFSATVHVKLNGGKMKEEEGGILQVSGADDVVLIYSAASSYNGFDKSPSRDGVDAGEKAAGFLKSAEGKDYSQLIDRHVEDYRQLFDRVKLDLGSVAASESLPTNERIKAYGAGKDPSLAALYFQFGRYLMIAGSRPGCQPLNLQGKWNQEIIPPWACGYTININTEMNYWPAEAGNLSECTEPLLRMIRELAVDGRRVAKSMYGARGWVAHHNTTLWRDAQPVDNVATCSFWPMGSGWLCQHLYEHYQFTGDKGFLEKEAYPLMKEACEFYIDWLVDDGHGQLVTPVSTSPENSFSYTGPDGKKLRASVSAGSAMDQAIIRQLFTDTRCAAEILGIDSEFQTTLKEKLAKLRPYQVGSKGQLLEWQEEFDEPEVHHRHCSHLFGLHPGQQIDLRKTPELAAAARRSLELRGDGGTGWSKAWKINFWARLEDGDHAQKMLSELLTQSTHPNLLDVCPPFQIDGNFGGCAGVMEMLVQSSLGEIHLLPALPGCWPSGQVKGLCTRGGYELDMVWKDGKLVEAVLRSKPGGPCKIRYGVSQVELSTERGGTYRLDAALKPQGR